MAVQEQISVIGSGLNYPTTKPIPSKSHMEVQVQNALTLIWSIVSIADYDLIGQSCVFNANYDLDPYTNVNVRVADTPNELATSSSDIGTVVGIKDEIVIVASIEDEVVTVAGIESEIVATAGIESQIRDVTAEPLRQSIIDGNANAGRAETAATASEASAVESEASYQRALLVEGEVVAQGDIQEARVITEGDDQVARVRAVGDVQDLRVENEGDTQVARLIADVDVAEDYAGWAEAEALNSDSWANAPVNTDVIQWTWDEINDVLVDAPRIGERSALHWQTIAQTVAAGLKFQATWDSVDCSLPTTPTPPAGELANGYFYIVASVTGDTTGCSTLSTGDWLVWSGDLIGDTVVEGQWIVIDWTFDWSAITGVPENVSNALSRSGGIMTSPATVSYDASAPASAEYVARSYIDALTALFMPVNAALPFTAVPRTTASQGTDVSELTRRDFVTGLNATQDAAISLNTAKPTLSESLLAMNPIGSVVMRMDAVNPATIYGGTWDLITGDASLTFGDGTVRDGVASGENTPTVPLLEHTHTFTGNALADHTHSYERGTGDAWSSEGSAGGPDQNVGSTTGATSAGTPSGTNANAGTAGVTLDVRGSRIAINVWQRTA